MTELASLPPGWECWSHEEGGRLVLTYRPDIFNAEAFDPTQLPTLVLAPGRSPDRPPEERVTTNRWHLALYLEPDIRLREVEASFPTRETALEETIAVAERFSAGEFELRSAYIDPPDRYLDRLTELIGPD